MTEEQRQDEDGRLTDALAGLLGHLREGRYGKVVEEMETALHGEADRFVDLLATHLRHEEEVLFPFLRRTAPETAPDLDLLLKEHGGLRACAMELAARIREKDRKGAYEVSRTFLAELLDHIDRERMVVDDRLREASI